MTTYIHRTELACSTIVQYAMEARTALRAHLFDTDKSCEWFRQWAIEGPLEQVYIYTFGGIVGGFIYGTSADFQTLEEFGNAANDVAGHIWFDYQREAADWLSIRGIY